LYVYPYSESLISSLSLGVLYVQQQQYLFFCKLLFLNNPDLSNNYFFSSGVSRQHRQSKFDRNERLFALKRTLVLTNSKISL